MRILRSLYHFLLFLIVSWTVYSTFIFICPLLPGSGNEFTKLAIFNFWNLYLFGALDFYKLFSQINDILYSWLEPWALREFWPLLIYIPLVNGIAAFIWCSNQNPLSACALALAPCISAPYFTLVFLDYRLLFFGMIGIVAFYGILAVLNDYRKKHWPRLSLPVWLEWRRPNMVPSLNSIAQRIEHMFSSVNEHRKK